MSYSNQSLASKMPELLQEQFVQNEKLFATTIALTDGKECVLFAFTELLIAGTPSGWSEINSDFRTTNHGLVSRGSPLASQVHEAQAPVGSYEMGGNIGIDPLHRHPVQLPVVL